MLVLIVSLLTLGQSRNVSERIPVVLTTDCGVEVDDQWALAHLAMSPRINLRAVVTTHAPGHSSAASAKSANAVLDLLELPAEQKPRVVAGSSRPLGSKTTGIANPGVDLILKETRDGTPESRIKLLAIGAATDVASALLLDPSLADRVEVVAMGFDSWPEGRDPWNVKNDVKAWQVLLDSRVPLVVGDGAVCKRCLRITVEEAHQKLDRLGPAGRSLADRLESWLTAHGELAARESGSRNAWLIWDEVTVGYLLGMAEVDEYPRPRLREELTFEHSLPQGTIRWVRSVKTNDLWASFVEDLSRSRPQKP